MTAPPLAPIHVTAWSATSALGAGRAAQLAGVRDGRCALRPPCVVDFGYPPLAALPETVVGRVDGLETPLPASFSRWDCRNNRLAWAALQPDGLLAAVRAARERHGPARVAVVMGTSTASIAVTESAYRDLGAGEALDPAALAPELQSVDSLTAFLQEALALHGPGLTVSTACSSSAKVFCTAERLLRLGVADAVLAGGVDSLCASTLFGFHALELVSARPCRPFDAARDGINIGEAAGFALLERGTGPRQLLGYGESSDAHHLSAPDPEGAGAERALDAALARAQLAPSAIDHLQLHGTATRLNDAVESHLLARRYTAATTASSSKGMIGHTLGAAGVMGSAFCWLALETGDVPGTINTREPDPALWPHVALEPLRRDVAVAATHNFAFGGSNCVLVWADGAASHHQSEGA